ncbi:MAG: hypothetical protein OIN90_10435 [Candidatus Methanoperedens sp.]|nr:hypothetical protein [Candidatus Methanoperedens sp.]MCX9087962.1 hypothetical protein [Candidatus Methanoperedens sp.]
MILFEITDFLRRFKSTQKALDIFEKIGLKNEAQKAKAQIEKMHL